MSVSPFFWSYLLHKHRMVWFIALVCAFEVKFMTEIATMFHTAESFCYNHFLYMYLLHDWFSVVDIVQRLLHWNLRVWKKKYVKWISNECKNVWKSFFFFSYFYSQNKSWFFFIIALEFHGSTFSSDICCSTKVLTSIFLCRIW